MHTNLDEQRAHGYKIHSQHESKSERQRCEIEVKQRPGQGCRESVQVQVEGLVVKVSQMYSWISVEDLSENVKKGFRS